MRWFDVDYPEVLELRERLLPRPEGDYHAIDEHEGKRLIQGIAGRFPSGRLLFDCYGTMGIRMQKAVAAVRRSGATLHWGIDDPSELEAWHEGLTCLDAPRYFELPGMDALPPRERRGLRAMALIPGLSNVGRILRYQF